MTESPKNIAVIGAGIMGICNAYALQIALPDAQITLFDSQGFPAKNASYMAGGMLAPYSELDHMPREYLEPAFASISLWRDISAALDHPFEFHQNGSLFISHDQDRHLLERFKSLLPHAPHDWKQIGAQEITTLEPALSSATFKNGLSINTEAHLHPQKVMDAMLYVIKSKQIQKIENIDALSDEYDYVIDSRGMGAKSRFANLRGVKGETLVVYNEEFKLSRPLRLMHPRYPLYIVPRDNNIFMIGATIIETEESDALSLRSGMELMSALYSVHKSFSDANVIDFRAGIRPSFDSNMPQIFTDKNIIECNGLFRHGYLFAPVMAQCVTSLVTQENYTYTDLFLGKKNNENQDKRHIATA